MTNDDRDFSRVQTSPALVGGTNNVVQPVMDLPLAARAHSIVQLRRGIGSFFRADLFGDPAFDMMLELFAAAIEGRRIKITNVAAIARVPQTTASRYIALLEKEGLVERYDHPHDRRITFVRLTRTGQDGMRRYLQNSVTQ